ncbi:hypothetical protein PENTCL1PPCAC_19371, partial [Pristionchus entomophagus]
MKSITLSSTLLALKRILYFFEIRRCVPSILSSIQSERSPLRSSHVGCSHIFSDGSFGLLEIRDAFLMHRENLSVLLHLRFMLVHLQLELIPESLDLRLLQLVEVLILMCSLKPPKSSSGIANRAARS